MQVLLSLHRYLRPVKSVIYFHSRSKIEYTNSSHHSPFNHRVSRSLPSWCIPNFAITRTEAALSAWQNATVRCTFSSLNAQSITCQAASPANPLPHSHGCTAQPTSHSRMASHCLDNFRMPLTASCGGMVMANLKVVRGTSCWFLIFSSNDFRVSASSGRSRSYVCI